MSATDHFPLPPPADPRPEPRPRRWLRRVLVSLAVLLLVLLALLALVPTLLSSTWVRSRIEAVATERLQRPVTLGGLDLGWDGRFALRDLVVTEMPEFGAGPLLALGAVDVGVDLGALLGRGVDVTLGVSDLHLRGVRGADGATNLDALLAAMGSTPEATAAEPPAPASAPAEEPTGPLLLPLESLRVTVRLDRLSVDWDDRAAGRSARVREGFLHADAASDGTPITVSAGAELAVDGNDLPPVSLQLTLRDVFGPGSELHPERAAVTAEGQLPGVSLAAQGGLGAGDPGAAATVRVDLPALLAAARPFLPPDLASLAATGTVTLDAGLQGDPNRAAEFRVDLGAAGLQVSGGPLGGVAAGPLDLATRHAGTVRLGESRVEVREGGLTLGDHSRIVWSANAVLPGPDPVAQPGSVDAVVGPVHLDLDRLLDLASPFLPLDLRSALAMGEAELGLDRLTAEGPLAVAAEPPSRHRIALGGLRVAVGSLRFQPGAADAAGVVLDGLEVVVPKLDAGLRGTFPDRAEGSVSVTLAGLETTGPNSAVLRDLSLSELQFSARDLAPGPTAPGGMTGAFALQESLGLGLLEVPGLARLERLEQTLALVAETGIDGRVGATVESLTVRLGEAEAAGWSLTSSQGAEPALGFALAGAEVRGAPLAGDVDVGLRGLALALVRVAGEQDGNRVRLEGLNVALPTATAQVRGNLPRQVALSLEVGLDDLAVEGPQSATLAGLRLTVPDLTAEGLAQDPAQVFGWAGRARLRQGVTVARVTVPGRADLTDLSQELDLAADLSAGGDTPAVVVGVPGFTLAGTARVVEPALGQPLPLSVAVSLPALTLRGTAPDQIDVEGLAVRADLGEALAAKVDVSARAGGTRAAASHGELTLDLGVLASLVPPELLHGARLVGTTVVNWQLGGRLPTAQETAALGDDPAALLSRRERLPFLDELKVSAHLVGVGADVALDQGRLAVGGLFTEPGLTFAVGPRGSTVLTKGGLDLRWIEALPGLPPLPEPWRARLEWDAGLAADAAVTLRESFDLAPVGLTQTLDLQLTGVERVLRAPGGESPLFHAVHGVDATLRFAAQVAEHPALSALAPEVQVKGPLDAGVSLRLQAGREVVAEAWLGARDAAVTLPGVAVVEGLDAAVRLSRRLGIAGEGAQRAEAAATTSYLSQAVLELPGSESSQGGAAGGQAESDRPEGGQPSRVAVRRLELHQGPVPLTVERSEVAFSLPGGLPVLERFQADLLGGTVRGGMALGRAGSGYGARGSVGFTGLDTALLVPAAASTGGAAEEDSEISGQLAFTLPLLPQVEALLTGLQLEGGLTHVGARTLDRALFALDPTESNEAIVNQRRMVRLGSPRWFRAVLRDGNLATAGQVQALGVDLNLPRIERFPVSRLPLFADLTALEPQLQQLLEVLDQATADRVEVARDGSLRFLQPRVEKP